MVSLCLGYYVEFGVVELRQGFDIIAFLLPNAADTPT